MESQNRNIKALGSFGSSLSIIFPRWMWSIGRWGWLLTGCLFTMAAHAQNSTWGPTPTTSDWNTDANWVGGFQPGPTDQATFGPSSRTTITFSADASAGALDFVGAPAYTFNVTHGLSFSQGGITLNGVGGPSTFNVSGSGSFIQFSNTIGSAADAIINVSAGGIANFQNTTSAGSAIITTDSGGSTFISNTSSGGQATFITNAGGTFDISGLTSGGTTAGSISGGGTYTLGPNALTVGANGLSTAVSGTIGGTGGSLIKVGVGTLILSGNNTYTGGTTVQGGVLSVALDSNLGATSGGITLQGGELLTTVAGTSFSSARNVTIGTGNILAAATGTVATYTGPVTGTGGLQIGDGTNAGTVFLASGANIYSGGTTVSGGATLQVNIDADMGDASFGITLNAGKLVTGGVTIARTLTLQGPGTLAGQNSGFLTATYSGLITGPGALTVGDVNSSTLTIVLANAGNDYTGGTTITGRATLRVAADAALGSLSGGITLDGGTLQTNTNNFASARAIALIANILGDTLAAVPDSPTPPAETTATYSGVISGAGMLTTGGGTVILTAANTYSGGTHIQNGVLSVANDGNLGAPNAGIKLDAGTLLTTVDGFTSPRPILLFNGEGPDTLAALNGTTATYTGPISGDGSFFIGDFNVRAGIPHGGTVVFTNQSNSYTSGTSITNLATLSVDSNSELGAPVGGIRLNDGELLTTANGFSSARTIKLQGTFNTLAAATGTTANYSGVISGNQPLAVGDFVNGGFVVLSGSNTYTAGTQVQGVVAQGSDMPSGGTLVAASDAALGTGPVNMERGILMIQAGVTIANPIIFDSGGIVNNAGTLTSDITDTFSVAEVVINSGSINANVTLGGGHDIVQLFTGSTITGNVDLGATTNAQLILDGAGQELLSQGVVGTINDKGTLIKQGNGVWTIDRALSAPLGTDILAGKLILTAALNTAQVNIAPAGTLQLGNGSSTGKLVDDGSLIFARSDTLNYGGIITGTGNLIQDGAGTTILSGRNTYSGGTIVNLGTLLVNNPQALGTGNVTVNGGVLGADPQPINVLGNYTQNAGGTLQLNIAGRSPGQFDTLNVTGAAALNGNLRLLNLGYQPASGDKLQLITAGGIVSGRFSAFQNPFSLAVGFDTIALVYAKNSVTLEFLKSTRPLPPGPPPAPIIIMSTDYASFALTLNQTAIGNALNAVQLAEKDPALVDFLASEPFAKLPGDLEKLSPESLSAIYEISFSAANVQSSNLEQRFAEIRNGSNGFSSSLSLTNAPGTLVEGKDGKAMIESNKNILAPSPENKWGVWVSGNGDYVNVSGDGNGHGYDFTTGGVTFGLDYRLTPHLAVGIAGSYAHTWTNLTGSGRIDADGGKAGLYATYFKGGLYLSGYAGGGYNSYSTRRESLGGVASGSSDSGEFDGYIGGGYDFHFGAFTVGPIASLQYTYVDVSGNDETGSLAPLRIQSKSQDSLRSNVGLSASYTTKISKLVVTPSVRASWQHEYSYRALPVSAQFGGGVGDFTVNGPSVGQDSAIVNAGINVQWTPTIGTYFGYNGQLGRDNYDSQGGTCSVHVDF